MIGEGVVETELLAHPARQRSEASTENGSLEA